MASSGSPPVNRTYATDVAMEAATTTAPWSNAFTCVTSFCGPPVGSDKQDLHSSRRSTNSSIAVSTVNPVSSGVVR